MASFVGIYIATRHPLLGEAIARALGDVPEVRILGTTSRAQTLLGELQRLGPTITLLDIDLADCDPLRLLRRITRWSPPRTLALGDSAEGHVIYDVLAAGAAGYLHKPVLDQPELRNAVAASLRNEIALGPLLLATLVQEMREREARLHHGLSPREQQVLALSAAGHSSLEIAAAMHLSVATVKTYKHRVYEKLGVNTAAAAAAAALRAGLID